MKRLKARRKDVHIEKKLTKEPSPNMTDRSSVGALAHHESKSSTSKGKSHFKSASSVPNEKAREEPLAKV